MLAALLDLSHALTPSALLFAAAALAITGLIVLTLAARRLAEHIVAGTPSRARVRRSTRVIVLRLCDPDAAGRPRPRAPSARRAATA